MRRGFTLIEMVFVIVIMGILSKFGVELLLKTYDNYVYSNVTNRLLNQSESAVKFISNHLQYRIKDSTIARLNSGSPLPPPVPIGSVTGDLKVLEWIGVDHKGQRTIGAPSWSGLIDLGASTATQLATPGSAYDQNESGAIFFVGSDVDLNAKFGWTGAIGDQNASMHRVKFQKIAGRSYMVPNQLAHDFSEAEGGVFEFYQFSKSAYGVSLEGRKLWFYYNYQPWAGDNLNNNVKKSLIMENVTSFAFTALGDILVIQVCVGDNNLTLSNKEYAICKEKVVF